MSRARLRKPDGGDRIADAGPEVAGARRREHPLSPGEHGGDLGEPAGVFQPGCRAGRQGRGAGDFGVGDPVQNLVHRLPVRGQDPRAGGGHEQLAQQRPVVRVGGVPQRLYRGGVVGEPAGRPAMQLDMQHGVLGPQFVQQGFRSSGW